MTTYVSINHAIVVSNKRHNRTDPPFEVRTAKDDAEPETVSEGTYTGTIRLVYNPDDPVTGNFLCWIEIDEEAPPPQSRKR